MASLEIISPFVSMLLVFIPLIFVMVLLKSSWFKGVVGEFLVHISAKINLNKSEKQNNNCYPKCESPMVVREAKRGPNRSNKFLGFTRFPRYRGTAAISWEDRLGQSDEIQPAFTDSWENGWEQNDETQSAFTDRAFH